MELHSPIRGGYNIFYRLEYKDGSSAASPRGRRGDAAGKLWNHRVVNNECVSRNICASVGKMRKRWEGREWMINYAARSSWAFDFIYCNFLDRKFFFGARRGRRSSREVRHAHQRGGGNHGAVCEDEDAGTRRASIGRVG